MSQRAIARYWFVYGNYDGWLGRWEQVPITVGKCERAYEAGQRAAQKGRFYHRHFFT